MKKQKKLLARSIRLPATDVEAWKAAADRLEISKSAFLRQALREKASAALDQAQRGDRRDDQRCRAN